MRTIEAAELRAVVAEHFNGNVSACARALNVPQPTLHGWLQGEKPIRGAVVSTVACWRRAGGPPPDECPKCGAKLRGGPCQGCRIQANAEQG